MLGRTGWRGSLAEMPEAMRRELDAAWDACLSFCVPRAAHTCVSPERLASIAPDASATFPPHRDWPRGIAAVSLFVCTVGNEVSAEASRAFAEGRAFSGAVLDACAGELVDCVADAVDAELEKSAASRGWRGTFRISPGYEPLSLLWNKPLLAEIVEGAAAVAEWADVSASGETGILAPRKTVLCLKGWYPS